MSECTECEGAGVIPRRDKRGEIPDDIVYDTCKTCHGSGTIDSEEDKYNWELFVLYCLKEGIGLDDIDDWQAWWDCWKAGVDANE